MAEEPMADKIQREILFSFLEEADEALADVDTWLVLLESDPSDEDNIGAIFRAIHTIKGNSTFFGLMMVKQLAHQMEDLLDLLRQGKFPCKSAHIDGLLAGVDELKAIIGRVRVQEAEVPSDQQPTFEALLASILSSIESSLGVAPAVVVEQLPGTSTLEPAASHIPTAAQQAQWKSVFEELRKLQSPSLNPAVAEGLTTLLEHLTELAPLSAVAEHAAALSATSNSIAPVPAALQTPVPTASPITPAQLLSLPPAAAQALAKSVAPPASPTATPLPPISPAPLPEGSSGPPDTGAGSRDKENSAPKAKAEAAGRTMRIEEARIEEFLDYVGELIITREMFGNVGKRLRLMPELNKISVEFQRAMTAFTALSHNLQGSIMEIRRVPVKMMLHKAPRIVRDVASKQHKEARVVLEGENIEVDKSLLEALEDPFVHMMRNAIDHGMEMPEARETAGKPRKGTITVSVTETADELQCCIRDDGGGIDASRLKAKAVAGGSLSDAVANRMSEEEAFHLVFNAGLSTAEVITEVSGRGVGMDVVKRNIVELGGRIDIQSVLGAGTSFTIHLPKAVSVQIFDGFLVRVGTERLVLPLRSVSESFRPLAEEVHTVVEQGECVERRGRVLPLLRSGDLLSLSGERRSVSESIVVSIEAPGGHIAGLLVDEVLGVQQVVLREVEGLEIPGGIFSGGAVLGDGLVAMVVDVERLGGLQL